MIDKCKVLTMCFFIGLVVLSDGLSAGTVKTFVFDSGFSASPGLNLTFARPVETLDHLGRPVAPNVPRYGATRPVIAVPSIELIRSTPNTTYVLGSGLDHNGTTPLLVVYERSARILDVFTVADDALLKAESSGMGRNRTDLSIGPSPLGDLLQGTIPDRGYRPVACAISHGLIVVWCTAYKPISDSWEPFATAIVISTDAGITWSLHFEDEEIQLNRPRGSLWSLQSWWPMEYGKVPLEAWFAGADYRRKPTTNGGRGYLFRASRSEIGQPWKVEPVAVVINEVTKEIGQHAHASGVVPFGKDGIRFITSMGDGFHFNRIISATRSDLNYTSGVWNTKDDYHGSIDSQGYQFVGCAPGPNLGDILVGSDENGGQIHLLHPDDDKTSRAAPRLLYGNGFEDGNGSRNLLIRTPTPELGGPYVATYRGGNAVFGADAMRILYSQNGHDWVEAFSPATIVEGVSIHGNHIYTGSRSVGIGLQRVTLPETLDLQPLLISSGGTNHIGEIIQVTQVGVGTTIIQLSQAEIAALVPQPPCFGPVFEVQTTLSETTLMAKFQLGEDDSEITSGAFHSRIWVQVIDSEGVSLKLRGNGAGGAITPLHHIDPILSHETWYPANIRDWLDPSGNKEPYLFTFEMRKRSVEDIFHAYVSFDTLTEGPSFPNYPLPPATMAPNELAAVSGFQMSPTWTVTLAGELPIDAWDVTTVNNSRWPLATLWANKNNYIEIIADTSQWQLLTEIVADGKLVDTLVINNVFWLRGTQFRVSIAGGEGTAITAGIGSSQLKSDASISNLILPPLELRFGNHDQTDIAAFSWFGGQIDEESFADQGAREVLLKSLDYLQLQGKPDPDLDGDGSVGTSDLLILLAAWGPCGDCGNCPADLDSDCVVGTADLLALLSNWG